MKRVLPIGLILLLTVALVWLSLLWNPEPSQTIKVKQAPKGGDFTLNSASGPVSLKAMRGKVVVLYFGYTMCPDVCPTSLSLLSTALNELSQEELGQIKALFISVDPDRDSLERLQAYATFFHPILQGVTGSNEQVAAVAEQYGSAYRKRAEDSAMGYVVDHTADLYVVDKEGKLQGSIRHGAPPSEILQVLRRTLAADSK
jgi:protein SCO1